MVHDEIRMILRFGQVELDDQTLTVTRAGERVDVQRRVLDLILYLVRNRDRVVSDQELFQKVWSGVAVTRASIAHSAMKARRALGDLGRAPTMIESVRGRGLRFIAEVVEVGAAEAPSALPPDAELVPSFSSTTESMFELARQMEATEFEQTLPFPFLVLPSQATGGASWAMETASASVDEKARASDLPSRIELFELWGVFDGPPVLSVGRTRACNIVVRAPSISKLHARFHLEPELSLEDLGSRNGTHVNGERLGPGRRVVRPGDTIHFGRAVSGILSAAALHALLRRMDQVARLRRPTPAPTRGGDG